MKIDPIIKKYTVVGIIDKNFHESNSILMSAEDAAELKGISTLQKEYLKSRGYDNMEVIVENIADVEEVSKLVQIKNIGNQKVLLILCNCLTILSII